MRPLGRYILAMESPAKYVVAVVLDPHYGPNLREIASQFDLWVVPSLDNREAIEKLRAEDNAAHRHQLTIWSEPKDLSLESTWLSMLDNIELHHGECSHDPPVTTLEIIGAKPNEAARRALERHEYNLIGITKLGFRASKVAAV
jgi:hypothetical protein